MKFPKKKAGQSLRDIKNKLKVGIVGCGAIGSFIARSIESGILKKKFSLIALCDIDRQKATELLKALSKKVKILRIDELIARVDLVIEASSGKAAYDIVKRALEGKKDALCMSVGGLIDKFAFIEKLANRKGCHLYLPSGAISGLDGLKAANIGKVYSVTLTTKKPPAGLAGAPYVIKNKIDLKKIKKETVLFKGPAEIAVKSFPQNVNVAAALSLCGIGAKKTIVKIVTSPEFTKNIHEIEIVGDFGKIVTISLNLPSKDNPKTSALAMLSAVGKLKGITSYVSIGT